MKRLAWLGLACLLAGCPTREFYLDRSEVPWEERAVRSVANLTRQDGEELLALAPRVPVRTEVEEFPLEYANEALDRLRRGEIRGSAVLRVTA